MTPQDLKSFLSQLHVEAAGSFGALTPHGLESNVVQRQTKEMVELVPSNSLLSGQQNRHLILLKS